MIPQDLTRQPDDTERPFWVWFADITAALLLIVYFGAAFWVAGMLSNKTDGSGQRRHAPIIHVHRITNGITINTTKGERE